MEPISYRIIRSDRKTAAIQITPSGEVIVRCPRRMSKTDIEQMLREKEGWLNRHLREVQGLPKLSPFTSEALDQMKAALDPRIRGRADYYARLIGVRYGRITLRAQRSRWGSCSGKGNLNFNCLLALAPPEVVDYIVIHELCHRKHMNHSPQFWQEVERFCPGYRERQKWLKTEGLALIGRLPK